MRAHQPYQAGVVAYRQLVWQVAWYGASPNPGGLVRRRKACPFLDSGDPSVVLLFAFPTFIFALFCPLLKGSQSEKEYFFGGTQNNDPKAAGSNQGGGC